MKPNGSELSYRRSAIEGASSIGLMIVLFDRLIADLRRAAHALRKNDIEGRCLQYNHALQVLAQLESWLDMDRGGEPAKAIALFYAQIRVTMMDAAGKQSAAILDKQIDSIVHVRSAWQLLDTPPPPSGSAPAQPKKAASLPVPEPQPDRVPFSQSA